MFGIPLNEMERFKRILLGECETQKLTLPEMNPLINSTIYCNRFLLFLRLITDVGR